MDLSLTNLAVHRPHNHQLRPLPHHRRPFFSKPISFPKTTSFSSLKPINGSFSNPNYLTPKSQTPATPLSFIKTTFIAGVTVTTIFFSRFTLKPTIAVPISTPPRPSTVETTDYVSYEEEERTLEEHLSSHPEDVKSLKTLMELKIKNQKFQEAIGVIDQLISLDPNDTEWPLLKSHLHLYGGDHESAKLGFEEILSKTPLRVEAYHGLVMAASGKESPNELKEVEKRIVEGIDKCKKEKKKDDVRDFKLLLAQIRVIEGDYSDALMIYQDLTKEEPRDFRPYLCQGIIYTLLGKKDDAEKSFQKYRRLVPKGHPYNRYFDENMIATKVFAEKVVKERAYTKS